MAALRTWWLWCRPSSPSSSCCVDVFGSTRTTMPLPSISLQHSSRSSLLYSYHGVTIPSLSLSSSSSSFLSVGMKRRSRSSELIMTHACCSSEGLEEGAAAAASDHDDHPLVELPLFPLPNSVLFPGAIMPLQIFEFRHRIMMHTLLQTAGADGDGGGGGGGGDPIRFGFVYSAGSKSAVGAAVVGCMGEVIKQERLVDDRFFLTCKGKRRFRVVDLVRTKPYVVARVRWLEDLPTAASSSSVVDGLRRLAREVWSCMEDVIRLSDKLKGKKLPGKETMTDLPCSRTTVERLLRRPAQFSYFVASAIFEGRPKEQQALLEMDDASSRIKREKEALWSRLSYLAAASAIEDAFDDHFSTYSNFDN